MNNAGPIRTETNRRRAELLRRLAADVRRRPYAGGLIESLYLDVWADDAAAGQLFAAQTTPPGWQAEAAYARRILAHIEEIARRTPGPFTATWAREAREWLMTCEQRAAVEVAKAAHPTRRSNRTTEVTR